MKNKWTYLVFFIGFVGFQPCFADQDPQSQQDPHTRRAWRQGRDSLLNVMELESERDNLPKRRWIRRDQRRLDDEINALLDDIIQILSVSDLTEIRKDYRKIEKQISGTRDRIRELREARINAPLEKTRLEFFRKTRDELTADIEALEENLRELENDKEALVRKLTEEYRRMGLQISESQVRFYLSTVSGGDVMELSALFHNVRNLNQQLEILLKENPGDPMAARRYYGIHVAMIRTLKRAHEVVIENIDDRYLVRIDALETRNNRLRAETETMLKLTPAPDHTLLEASYRTQQVTDEALQVYRQHLHAVRDQIYEVSKTLDQRLRISQNAYDTIRVSTTLITEMQAAVNDINALRDMHLPDLMPIDDEAVRQKFEEITESLLAE
ncbi:MAG: hypothetical protein JJU29_16180 [Verrucomicrobia bacterium]|nr:hypothetical protein [Verrucomicrobiota bacterium]MCH8513590.1 hypothetical protein [Kiritimatiellia bacterium]